MVHLKELILEIYDSELQRVGLVDEVVSLLWTSRFNSVGSFELVCEYRFAPMMRADYFIMRSDTNEVFQIREVISSRDANGIALVTVRGYDVLNILSQRVIYHTIVFSGDVVNYIKRIINENVIAPSSSVRQIPLFSSITGSTIGKTIKAQSRFDNVLEKVLELCKQNQLGLTVTLNNGAFVISIQKAVTKTIYQSTYNPIVFSDELENLSAWSFSQDYNSYKTFAYIAGEGEGKRRKTTTIGQGFNGLDRYELYVDARDLSTEAEEGTTISETDYLEMLAQRGYENLAEHEVQYSFNAEVIPGVTECALGDIVTIDTGLIIADGLVSEITETFDSNGYARFPSFEVVELRFVLATENDYDITTETGDLIVT